MNRANQLASRKSLRTPGVAFVVLAVALFAVACTTTPAPVPTATPAPGGVTGPSIYGSGMAGDNKGNIMIKGGTGGDMAVRFRASSSAAPSYLIWPCRTGSGYSGGNGGTIRMGIMADDGTAQHRPDGKWLTYTDVKPGNPGGDERFLRTDFSGAPALVAGRLYHVVYRNVSADPESNFVSVNNLSKKGAHYSPRQPAFADTDLELLWDGPSNWRPLSHTDMGWVYTPHFDLTLADGTHEGNAYGFADRTNDRLISGTTQMVRERFTVSGGDKTVTEVYVRLGRQSGTGKVTLRLENDAGNVIESISVSGSHIAKGTAGVQGEDQNWVGGALATPRKLVNGKTYRLRVSTQADSVYWARSVRWKTFESEGDDFMRSWHFEDGAHSRYGGAEYSTDGGSSWDGVYNWLPQDLQFYFVVR